MRMQHHQTSFESNAKGNSLGREKKKKKKTQLQTRKSQMRKLNGKGKHTVNVGNHPHTNMIYKQI